MIEISKAGPVAIVRYDRGGKANALNLAALTALEEAAAGFEHDTTTQVIVLTGTATRFCAGVDLSDADLWAPQADTLARHDLMGRGSAMCARWARLPQLTIAAVEGHAIGGGAVLALSLDLRVLAADARLRLPEIRLGLTLSWGGLPRLVSLVGPARAKHMLFADRQIGAEEALALGLCEQVAPAGTALAAALALAQDMALCPPLALRLTKRAIDAQCAADRYAHGETEQFLLAREIMEREKAHA